MRLFPHGWLPAGFFALAIFPFLHGCASLIHGGRQEITFDSKPPGTSVRIANDLHFLTPQVVSLPRNKGQIVVFEKEGYESQQIEVTRDFDVVPTILGNLLWLPIGLVVDVVTGAAWKLEPRYISIELPKKKKVK